MVELGDRLEDARGALAAVGCNFIELGVATRETGILLAKNGVERPIEKRGWEHFVGA